MNTKLTTLLTALVAANISFTAYDVTLALRNAGEQVGHYNETRPAVHDFMKDQAGWNRVLQFVGGPAPAWVYYADAYGVDPSDYSTHDVQAFATKLFAPAPQVSNTTPKPLASPAPVAKVSTPVPASVVASSKLDQKNRLRVPVNVTRAAGIKPRQVVYVDVDSKGGTVTFNSSLQKSGRAYSVDVYGNIRVALGNDIKGNVFNFTVDSGKIVAQVS